MRGTVYVGLLANIAAGVFQLMISIIACKDLHIYMLEPP